MREIHGEKKIRCDLCKEELNHHIELYRHYPIHVLESIDKVYNDEKSGIQRDYAPISCIYDGCRYSLKQFKGRSKLTYQEHIRKRHQKMRN